MRKATKCLFTTFIMTLIICFLGIANGFAQVAEEPDFKPVAEEMIGSSGITWMPKVSYAQLVLNISKPDGTVFSKTFDRGASPYINLGDIMGDSYLEGSFTYELRVVPVSVNQNRDEMNAVQMRRAREVSLTQTGYFSVQGGMIITPGVIEPKNVISTSQDGLSGTKDQVILDDLIVDGSACIGQDCVNGENFGFDTLRLKENNLRIKFQDTSNSGSFPSNDWQITANDSSNGGANRFSIDDVDSGKTPFTIEAGARSNALYVDDSGRLGFGTATPVVNLHEKYGDTPTLRLEQDNSLGWPAQTWDVAGNEANFFVRDVSHSSHLAFRIMPGSGNDNGLVIAADGDIGLGTESPSASLHVKGVSDDPAVYVETNSTTNAKIIIERDGGARSVVGSAGSFTYIGSETDNALRLYVNNSWRLRLNNTSNSKILEMSDNGYYDGNWVGSSSRELKENIKNLTADEAIEALEGLNPVRYNYKRNREEEHVGFIAEDVPELVAQNDRKSLSTLDIVGVLTKVVQEQQKLFHEQQRINQEQQKTILQLKKEIAELKKK